MKIIISPAKKMNTDTDFPAAPGIPVFLEKTRALMQAVRKLSPAEAKAVWKCNDKLAELNYRRFQSMDLERGLTPAVLSYEGLQYQHMAPAVFSETALQYIEEHLRILSGFYGVLKPFDGVTPYRLEMQAKLSVNGKKDLYDFWGDSLYRELTKDGDKTIVNLASKEYSKAVEKYLSPEDRFITVEFGELTEGKVKQKGTFAKMARGEMVRFMAENQVEDVEKLRDFQGLGLSYCGKLSDDSRYVFVKQGREFFLLLFGIGYFLTSPMSFQFSGKPINFRNLFSVKQKLFLVYRSIIFISSFLNDKNQSSGSKYLIEITTANRSCFV